jgi:hypothetical protein
MDKADGNGSADNGTEQTDETINQSRREALSRFAKYTAPAMLGLLLSGQHGVAAPVGSAL